MTVNNAHNIGNGGNGYKRPSDTSDVGRDAKRRKIVVEEISPKVLELRTAWESMNQDSVVTTTSCCTALDRLFQSKDVSDSEVLGFLRLVRIRPDGGFFTVRGKPTKIRANLEQFRPDVAKTFFQENEEEQISSAALKLKEVWERITGGPKTNESAQRAYTFLSELFYGTHGTYNDKDLLDFLHIVKIRPDGGFFFYEGKQTKLRSQFEELYPKAAEAFFSGTSLDAVEEKEEKPSQEVVSTLKEYWNNLLTTIPSGETTRSVLFDIFKNKQYSDADIVAFLREAGIRPTGGNFVRADKTATNLQLQFRDLRPKAAMEFFGKEEPVEHKNTGFIGSNSNVSNASQNVSNAKQNIVEEKLSQELVESRDLLRALTSDDNQIEGIVDDVILTLIQGIHSDREILNLFREVPLQPNSTLFFAKNNKTALRIRLEQLRPEVAKNFFSMVPIEEKEPIIEIEDEIEVKAASTEVPRNELVPIYLKNAHQYPQVFETKPFQMGLDTPLLCHNGYDEEQEEYAAISSFQEYFNTVGKKVFISWKGQFDLHDRNFQDLAIHLLKDYGPSGMPQCIEQYGNAHRKAISMLFRARNYAIATRPDVDAMGRFTDLSSTKEKQELLKANRETLVLRDWGLKPTNSINKKPGTKNTEFFVIEAYTKDATLELARKFPELKVCWLNLANAHKTCGGYQLGEISQEEGTAPEGDSAAVLGCVSEVTPDGRTTYRDGFHIPPGGNYFHKTCFFTDEGFVDCYTIVQPFADFRNRDYTERADFFSKDGSIKDPHLYNERIKLDMRSALRTAKEEGIDIPILGASGCGAFCHDPHFEANAWSAVLQEPEFRGHFTKVCFAVIGDGNLVPFQNGLKGLIG